MKKIVLIITLIFSIHYIAFTQEGFYSMDEYRSFKTRTLLVIVEEPNEKLLTKLNAEKVLIYKTEIDEYNKLMRWSLEQYYPKTFAVEFVKRSEIFQRLLDDSGKKLAYLEFSKFGSNYMSEIGFDLVQKNRMSRDQTRLTGAISLSSIVSVLDVRFSEDYKMIEDNRNVRARYRQFLSDPFPSQAAIAFAVRQMVANMQRREEGVDFNEKGKASIAAAKKLSAQKLLVCESDISADADRIKMQKAYRHQLEFVNSDTQSSAIINSTPGVSTVLVIPKTNHEDKVVFEFVVFDCESGNILTTSSPQDAGGVMPGSVYALKKLKSAVADGKIPELRKENLIDFYEASK